MLPVETTLPSRVDVENAPARLARLKQLWLPGSVSWYGTTLLGSRLAHAIAAVSETLADRGIGPDSIVVLESDDGGRTFLVFLALVDRGARVILASEAAALPPDAYLATHTVVLHDAARGEIDIRLVLRRIEREVDPTGSEDASESVGIRIHAWFERRRILAVRSSGTTTGEPELVWKDGPDLVENALDTARAAGYGVDDVFLPLLPLSGQYGLSVMLIATVIGAGIVFSNRTKVAESLRTIARTGVTATDAAPLLYQRVLDELTRHPEHVQRLTSVRVFGVGGEGLSRALVEEFRAATGRVLLNGYGLAQLGNVGFCDGVGGVRGFRLVDAFRARAVGGLDHRILPDGAVGRIQIARRDGAPFAHLDAAEWFDTGDVGAVNGDHVEIAGREGAVNRNGTIVHLAWIEKRLAEHGVCGIAVPERNFAKHRYWLVVADRIRRPSGYWRERIDAILGEFRPDRIQILALLPEDTSGKVSRARLSAFVAELSEMRAGGRSASDSLAGRLRATAKSARAELTALITGMSDHATAVRDLRSMLNALDHAEAELALHGRPPALPVDVFMTRNAILECFAGGISSRCGRLRGRRPSGDAPAPALVGSSRRW